MICSFELFVNTKSRSENAMLKWLILDVFFFIFWSEDYSKFRMEMHVQNSISRFSFGCEIEYSANWNECPSEISFINIEFMIFFFFFSSFCLIKINIWTWHRPKHFVVTAILLSWKEYVFSVFVVRYSSAREKTFRKTWNEK